MNRGLVRKLLCYTLERKKTRLSVHSRRQTRRYYYRSGLTVVIFLDFFLLSFSWGCLRFPRLVTLLKERVWTWIQEREWWTVIMVWPLMLSRTIENVISNPSGAGKNTQIAGLAVCSLRLLYLSFFYMIAERHSENQLLAKHPHNSRSVQLLHKVLPEIFTLAVKNTSYRICFKPHDSEKKVICYDRKVDSRCQLKAFNTNVSA